MLLVIENPKAALYPVGSPARLVCDTFNSTYTSILKTLHETFTVSPNQLDNAIDLMDSLSVQAMNLMAIDLGNGTHAGPSFEYRPDSP